MQNDANMSIAELEQRIKLLIPENSYIYMAQIPSVYLNRYDSALTFPKKGSLTSLVNSMPELQLCRIMETNAHVVRVRPVSPAETPKASTVDKQNSVAKTGTSRTDPRKVANERAGMTKAISEMQITDRAGSNMQLSSLVEAQATCAVAVSGLSSFIFASSNDADDAHDSHQPLFTTVDYNLNGCGYLGRVGSSGDDDYFGIDEGDSTKGDAGSSTLYINTSEPFCTVCIGVQGAGKSHTMNVMLENCMLGTVSEDEDRPIISTQQPMSGLVLHFDQSQSNVCEAVGLKLPAAELSNFPQLKVQKLVILVSPSFYKQRKEFYGDQYEVAPLLFDWASLSALQLRKLMRLTDTDSQLYVSTMLNLLRDYQRNNQIPVFLDFVERVGELCNASGQSAPLKQRLELLQNFVRDSAKNLQLRELGLTFTNLLESGTLVVADLTDPMLSPDEACGVFQVLLEQFRGHNLSGVGKVVTFDEAHKYLNNSGPGCVELSNAIVDTVRLMRHEGMRVLISTQSPLTMPPELLELSSATILHRFQSADWCKYLASKVTLPDSGFERIKQLRQGQALLLSTHMDIPGQKCDQVVLNVRRRLTQDLGASRRNKVKLESNTAKLAATDSSGALNNGGNDSEGVSGGGSDGGSESGSDEGSERGSEDGSDDYYSEHYRESCSGSNSDNGW